MIHESVCLERREAQSMSSIMPFGARRPRGLCDGDLKLPAREARAKFELPLGIFHY